MVAVERTGDVAVLLSAKGVLSRIQLSSGMKVRASLLNACRVVAKLILPSAIF